MPVRAKPRSRRRDVKSPQNHTVRNVLIAGIVVAGVVGLAVLLFLNLRPSAEIPGVVMHPRPSRGHDNTLELSQAELPPVGGTHHDIWQNCGIYTEPIPAENAIHSLEHGAVWVTYQPDLPADQVQRLQDLVRGESFILLSPYPQQRSPVVLTAWSVQLEVESAGDERVEQFVDRYRLGPTTPERGASCSGGVGEPIS